MITITYRLGSAAPLVLAPEQPDGTLPALADLGMELRIHASGQCIALPGAPMSEGYAFDLSALDLPRGLYVTAIWLTDPTGPSHAGDIFLLIEGGC